MTGTFVTGLQGSPGSARVPAGRLSGLEARGGGSLATPGTPAPGSPPRSGGVRKVSVWLTTGVVASQRRDRWRFRWKNRRTVPRPSPCPSAALPPADTHRQRGPRRLTPEDPAFPPHCLRDA